MQGLRKEKISYIKILNEFDSSDYENWRMVAEQSLKGKPVSSLYTKLYEEITTKPIYTIEDLQKLRGSNNTLKDISQLFTGIKVITGIQEKIKIAQSYTYLNPKDNNKSILQDINNGLNSIYLKPDYLTSNAFNPDSNLRQKYFFKGVSIFSIQDFEIIFKDIQLENLSVYFDNVLNPLPLLALFLAYLNKNNFIEKNIFGGICFDPLASLLIEGKLPFSISDSYRILYQLISNKKSLPEFSTFIINGGIYNECGANAIQELAFSLSTAIQYIRELKNQNLTIDDIVQNAIFKLNIGPDFFIEVAKLRATRILWAKIIKTFGGNEKSQKVKIHTNTCIWNKSKLDPYVNILRNTCETMAAILGGADCLDVRCFDENLNIPNDFSRRNARNTQLILSDECNLSDVIDPSAGSYYIEELTDILAQKAWNMISEIESIGGMFKSIKTGYISNNINKIKSERIKNYSAGNDTLVGTNKYPNNNENISQKHVLIKYTKRKLELKEYMGKRINVDIEYKLSLLKKEITGKSENLLQILIESALSGATIEEISNSISTSKSINIKTGLKPFKASEPFEELKRSDNI